MKKIVILDGYTENPGDLSWSGMKALGQLTVYDRTTPEDIVNKIGDAELVITNKTPLTREIFEQCKNIRYVGVLATGYNVVDVECAKEKHIPVCNIPTYGTNAVAQYVFALLLEMCHHVQHHSDAVKAGRWTTCPDFCFWDFPLEQLTGKTMGVIGFGRIGQATAKIAAAFGMKVLAYDSHTDPALENEALHYASLDELLAASDVVSLHCPLFDSTRHIINRENILKMKDGVKLINTSRGPLIDEEALAEALSTGKVSFAAVDVVSTEPIQTDNPLLKAENILITPHIAWAPKESRQILMDIAVDNVKAFLAGRPQNVVNPM